MKNAFLSGALAGVNGVQTPAAIDTAINAYFLQSGNYM